MFVTGIDLFLQSEEIVLDLSGFIFFIVHMLTKSNLLHQQVIKVRILTVIE